MTTRRIVSEVQLTREEMLAAVEGNTTTLEDWDDIADAAALKVLDYLAVLAAQAEMTEMSAEHLVCKKVLALRAWLRG